MSKIKPLPTFEGSIPDHVTFVASGSITEVDDQPDGCPALDDWLTLECTAQVVGVNHKRNKDGELIRVVTVKMDTMRTPSDEDDGDEE